MNRELLFNKHSKILGGGCSYSAPQGWNSLIDKLCTNLQKLTEEGHPQVRAVQVKEKFGYLRFYIKENASTDQIKEIMNAERQSVKTCTVCGKDGEINMRRGWISPKCEDHS